MDRHALARFVVVFHTQCDLQLTSKPLDWWTKSSAEGVDRNIAFLKICSSQRFTDMFYTCHTSHFSLVLHHSATETNLQRHSVINLFNNKFAWLNNE